MSIAILSIPLGIVSIILFAWSINKMGNKPAKGKGKKKDDDTALIEIIVSVILFFVALGIYDGSASTAGLFSSDNAAQEEAAHHSNDINSSNVDEIIKTEIGHVFSKVLEHAGVYKRDDKGLNAFDKFVESV